MYKIKNDYIDTIITKDYKIPVAKVDEENRYSNWSELAKPQELIKYLNDAEILKNKKIFSFEMCAFSELVSSTKFKYYHYEDLYFKIKLDDIISFSIPVIGKVRKDYYKYWRLYVRRNGKECWV